jgi:O-antigen/teichoic acid export membrane protein
MSKRWIFVKNAVANIARGGAASIVAVVLPPILLRHMNSTEYAVWVLVLQLTAYVAFLDFGLQTAVGRYIAFAEEIRDVRKRDGIFSTAYAGLGIMAAAGTILLLVAVAVAPRVFPHVPGHLVADMRLALLIVGVTVALGLPASAWNGVFIGLQKYEVPALTVGGGKLLAAAGLAIVVVLGGSLVHMALVVAAANLLSYAVQYLCLRCMAPGIRFHAPFVQRSTAHELFAYCFGMTVMSFSILLVTGFDLLLVGRFDFAVVTPYSAAASLIAVVSGLMYAIIGVMMPHAAALQARNRPEDIGKLVISSTRLATLLLVFSGIPALIYAGPLLRVWIGAQYVQTGRPILILLLVANLIRLLGGAYAVVLMSTAQHQMVKISPLAEGIANILASIVLGSMMGGIGVALGTLLGSIVSVTTHLFYSMPRTQHEIRFSRREYAWSGVIVPCLCTAPLLGTAALSIVGVSISRSIFLAALGVSLLAAAALLDWSGSLARKKPLRQAAHG